VDVIEIRKRVMRLPRTLEGQMRLLHQERNSPYQGVPFNQRTLGDLLEEFYIGTAQELLELKRREAGDLSADEERRLALLTDIMEGNIDAPDRRAVFDLDEDEAEEVWFTAHKTGDALADYWEKQIAAGEEPDFDLEEVPDEESA
jgi:hypothetical protein